MTEKKPRGKCPYCGRKKAVTIYGLLHKHKGRDGVPCGGSGARPS